MLAAARNVKERHPDGIEIKIADGIPFAEYVEMMRGSDAICDQLYSYTPAMNALEAMSHGIIVIGGGEPENYEILHEDKLRPIINVTPEEGNVESAIEDLVSHPERMCELKLQSMEYVKNIMTLSRWRSSMRLSITLFSKISIEKLAVIVCRL